MLINVTQAHLEQALAIIMPYNGAIVWQHEQVEGAATMALQASGYPNGMVASDGIWLDDVAGYVIRTIIRGVFQPHGGLPVPEIITRRIKRFEKTGEFVPFKFSVPDKETI